MSARYAALADRPPAGLSQESIRLTPFTLNALPDGYIEAMRIEANSFGRTTTSPIGEERMVSDRERLSQTAVEEPNGVRTEWHCRLLSSDLGAR